MRSIFKVGLTLLLLASLMSCAVRTIENTNLDDPRFHPTFPHVHEGMTAKQVDDEMTADGFGPIQTSLVGDTLTTTYSAMVGSLSHLDVMVQFNGNLIAKNVSYFSN